MGYSGTIVQFVETRRIFKAAVLFGHGIAGWAYCGALTGIGRKFLPFHTTLVVHAVGAPLGFALISLLYFRKFAFTTPLQTALIFLALVVGLDFFPVAPVFERSYVMFTSFLGTWLPFALIFMAVYITGAWVAPKIPAPVRS